MKNISAFMLICLFTISSNRLLAQISGDNIFLPGHWAEVGIAPNGALGSTVASVPAGYFPRSPTLSFRDPGTGVTTSTSSRLALVYDYGHDGWTIGTPAFFGDFQLPGTPYEGWSLEINGIQGNAWDQLYELGGTGYSGSLAMGGNNVSYTNAGGELTGVWQGTVGATGALSISQITTIDTNGSAILFTVTLKNIGATTLNNIYYMRSLDPDNDDLAGGGFNTNNYIDYQNDSVHRVMVHATGLTHANAFLGLATLDARAKCFSGVSSVWPTMGYTASAYYAGTITSAIYSGSVSGDNAMGLVYNLDSLTVGDSTTIRYAYIFNGIAGFDSVFSMPKMVVNGVIVDSIDTVTMCAIAGDSVSVQVLYGESLNWSLGHWSWTPTTGLSSDTGINNKIGILALSGTTTFTITGTDTALGTGVLKTFLLTVIPNYSITPDPIVSDTSFLMGGISGSLTAIGSGLLWYTSDTSSIGSSIAPVPSTSVAGTTTWYVTQTIDGCKSTRDSMTVTILNTTIYGADSICVGAITTFTDSVSGGVWSSSNIAIATISSVTGVISGIGSGTVSITYLDSGAIVHKILHVVTLPVVAVISGSPTVCAGSSMTLTDATTGGTWIASNGHATVSSTIGAVAGVTAGIDTILYTVTNACGPTSANYTVTVDPLPDAGTITGPSALCPGNSITLSNAVAGGTWSSAFTIIATISSAGVVTGVSSGSDIIKYTVTNSCGTAVVRDTIIVYAPDTPQICVVMIDSATGKNQVVWNQTGLHRAEQYNIYRLSSASVFVPIGSQASTVFSTFIDTGSYPLLQSYSYKMTLTDSCGNESDTTLSTIHTTTHLTASIGVGGVVNLNWNVYVGKPITTQEVMRSIGGGAFTSIASVANTVISYTDPAPPIGAVQYAIADITPTGCSPSARTMTFSYDSIVSNPVALTITGIVETSLDEHISVFPNPITNDIHISSALPIYHVVISNMIGRSVYSGTFNSNDTTIGMESLPAGVYILRVNDSHVFRVVKE